MKYLIPAILTLTMALPVVANNNQNNNQNQQQASWALQCENTIQEVNQITDPAERAQKLKESAGCEEAARISQSLGNGEAISTQTAYQTTDGRAVCKKVAGYSVDYNSCVSTAKMYDALLVAASALELQAEVRAQNTQQEIAQKAQSKALAGDVQGAGLQASRENSSTMKQINQEKAAAYSAAVAALTAKIATWVDDGDDFCEGDTQCATDIEVLSQRRTVDEIFPNKDQKSTFTQAALDFAAKGAAAGITAGKYKSSEEAVAKIQQNYEEDLLDVQFDECTLNPTAKKCLTPGQRISGESYSPGTGNFTIGGAESNSFDLGEGSSEFGELGDAANVESQQVASINSPFADEVKEANEILDQAGAASAGSGGPAPAGGGGGGGMGGGGSASLGNDTKTPEETAEEAEIKAKKASAGYASGGAKGFSGVKSSKEESNPFASLFDQKGSSGGIEEDRSIASNDIDDKSSVLFKKISKKYSEMHSNKRIEANNLELE